MPVVELAVHAESSTLYVRSYGRTSKFFRLDGLLLFCIIMGLRSTSSAISSVVCPLSTTIWIPAENMLAWVTVLMNKVNFICFFRTIALFVFIYLSNSSLAKFMYVQCYEKL